MRGALLRTACANTDTESVGAVRFINASIHIGIDGFSELSSRIMAAD